VSKRFAKAGASVYIVGRNETLGNQVVEELKALGGTGKTFEFIKADLSSPKSVKEVAATLQKKAGPNGINYLVQTQGTSPLFSYFHVTEADPTPPGRGTADRQACHHS
jgi:NAD(P)-dependent dehydrogenase (short-subunit alcohol dehydrogenase family)